MRRLRGLPILILAGLTIFFFWKLALTDLILARGDTFAYFYPYWDARNAAMQTGQLPLWSPDIFMGIPLLANPQLGTYYPPNWVTIPFDAPQAIRISILTHVFWAALGVYTLYWHTISKRFFPALLAAIVFAFGGYVGAHIEQINQLQGIAWMAWLFLFYHQMRFGQHRLRWGILLAIGFAMQIFSGHTQTVFITGFGLGLYAIGIGLWGEQKGQRIIANLIALGLAAISGALLAIPQLLPTLELTGMSNRSGGFSSAQATAFSLYPLHIGRTILPSYDVQLLGEAVATIGVVALGLAIIAIISNQHKQRWLWVFIAIIGILFAFGRYNPLYWALTSLPGFNLFRVPARWLSLYALAIALLAGIGWETLDNRRRNVAIALPVLAIGGLMVIAYLFPLPQSELIGQPTPARSTIALWLLGAVATISLIWTKPRLPQWISNSILFALVIVELFFAARTMPHQDLVAPEVYSGQRFTISQMLAYNDDVPAPPRFLGISALQFDTGDRGDLRQRYERLGMDEQAIQTAFTAIKKAEVIAPNLPLTWQLQSMDGFGGGVLPTIYYSQFTSLLLPDDTLRTLDGRIGEMLALPACRGACVPPMDYLHMTHTHYLITDKVFDIVQNGVRFDTTFAGHWMGDLPVRPEFEFDEVQILHDVPLDSFNDSQAVDMDASVLLSSATWDDLLALSDDEQSNIVAVTVIDNRTGDFVELQPASWARVLSSDIKLYEMQNAANQRISLASTATILPDDWDGHEAALDILDRDSTALILHGDVLELPEIDETFDGSAEITQYTPIHVEIRVSTTNDAYLMLKDAYYPGWRATIDGDPTPVYRANVLFRAVQVPSGEHLVRFEFVPVLWYRALWAGMILWLVALGGLMWIVRRPPSISDGSA